MRKLVIGVDLDSTCADLLNPWLGQYNKDHAEKHGPLMIEDLKGWYIEKTTHLKEKIFDYLLAPKFFAELPLYPGVDTYLGALAKDGHRIVVTTACQDLRHAQDKLDWVKKHLPYVDRKDVFFGHNKDILGLDVFIDDAPHQAEIYKKRHPKALVLGIEFPYNENRRELWDCLAKSYTDTNNAWHDMYVAIQNHIANLDARDAAYQMSLDMEKELFAGKEEY